MRTARAARAGWAVLGLAVLLLIGSALFRSREEPAGQSSSAAPAEPWEPAPAADPEPEPAGIESDIERAAVQAPPVASTECAPGTGSDPSAERTIGMPSESDLAEVRTRLLGSPVPEHLAAAALLAKTTSERLDHAARAIEAGRDNPLVVWTAVLICNSVAAAVDCPIDEWQRDLLRLDNQNGEVWALLAANRFRGGDADGALTALQTAAAAPEMNDYFAESVWMLQRAVASAGGYSFREQALIAFRVAGTPNYIDYISMCEQAKANRLWAEACLEYGRLAERGSATIVGRAASQSIQVLALEAMGYDASQVAARRAAESRAQAAAGALVGTPELVLESPERLASFLLLMKEEGEWSANVRTREEAAREREQGRQADRGAPAECR